MEVKKIILENIEGRIRIKKSSSPITYFSSAFLQSHTREGEMVISNVLNRYSKKKEKITYDVHIGDLQTLEVRNCHNISFLDELTVDNLEISLTHDTSCIFSRQVQVKKLSIQLIHEATVVFQEKILIEQAVIIMMNSTSLLLMDGNIDKMLNSLEPTVMLDINKVNINIINTSVHNIQYIKKYKKEQHLKFENPYIDGDNLYYGDIKAKIPKDALKTTFMHEELRLSDDKSKIYLNSYEYSILHNHWRFRYGFVNGVKNLKKEISLGVISVVIGIIYLRKLFKK